MSKKKVGIVLSGCGVKDGSEIHESVLALLHVDKNGADPVFLAPDKKQLDVVDHLHQKPLPQERNVLLESARIARGAISSLLMAQVESVDALIFPGGFGAAKNLCTYAVDGTRLTVDSHVERLVKAMHQAKKPIGAICIAPVLVAKVLGPDFHIRITIGKDAATARDIESFGARHIPCEVHDIVVDEAHKIVSTPAYMLATCISEVESGVAKLVAKVLALA